MKEVDPQLDADVIVNVHLKGTWNQAVAVRDAIYKLLLEADLPGGLIDLELEGWHGASLDSYWMEQPAEE